MKHLWKIYAVMAFAFFGFFRPALAQKASFALLISALQRLEEEVKILEMRMLEYARISATNRAPQAEQTAPKEAPAISIGGGAPVITIIGGESLGSPTLPSPSAPSVSEMVAEEVVVVENVVAPELAPSVEVAEMVVEEIVLEEEPIAEAEEGESVEEAEEEELSVEEEAEEEGKKEQKEEKKEEKEDKKEEKELKQEEKKETKEEKKAEKEDKGKGEVSLVSQGTFRRRFASFLTALSEVVWRIDKLFR